MIVAATEWPPEPHPPAKATRLLTREIVPAVQIRRTAHIDLVHFLLKVILGKGHPETALLLEAYVIVAVFIASPNA